MPDPVHTLATLKPGHWNELVLSVHGATTSVLIAAMADAA